MRTPAILLDSNNTNVVIGDASMSTSTHMDLYIFINICSSRLMQNHRFGLQTCASRIGGNEEDMYNK
jgi:hypothetical protein